ncbi:transcriptional regulator [Ktedonobacter sp. SOSP1-85]|uniref:helix-turn-helix transcriptional regulator n=1 Tax=Ktedonobacter sp. SOSP1-85 TaxID=2778367 RepID=UPI001915087E|nr:YafY family protein [Ktedonobacter sp. SOSP1-85]GHO78617.1 transcriptional regulator [Ktedonobacter sp. SOSP1-85]
MVYRPTARVLTVLELLQAHGRMTGNELAHRLEVNIRTVRDYIETLSDLGIPVEAERGRYGAYRLRPGYKLPPLIFTEDEALALTLSLMMARENGLAQTSPAFEGTLAKIERVLPVSTRERIQAVGETVVIENSSAHAAPSIVAVMMLSTAVQSERSVRLSYHTPGSEVTERLFDPYGVVAHEGFWYTIGYCHLRQAQRLFRLDRIVKIEMTSEPFRRPENFETLPAVQRALASVPRVWQVEVWLEATLEEAQRQSRLSKGHFTEVNQGVLVRSEVGDLPWMARLLAGMGLPFVIHHPSELREMVRQYALTLMGYAERTRGGQAEM